MKIGHYQQQVDAYKAFVLLPFPPKEGFLLSKELIKQASEATLYLGKLDGITQLLPDLDFFLLMYIRKDATSSNQIEGTRATFLDAIQAEAKIDVNIPDDVDDILHYISALKYGLKRLEEFPLSLRFIKEIHKELMGDARSDQFSDPGNFRQSQNWIGGTTPVSAHFVPPPVHEMMQSLGDLEKFLHTEDNIIPIIKAGLLHSQFETIHPFLDGNGRTGRLLITAYLWYTKLISQPTLFLSTYFKKHQKVYYAKLDAYHEGEIEEWLTFFLEGVIETSKEAIETVKKITVLRAEDSLKIQSLSKTASESAAKVFPKLFELPIVNVEKIVEWTGYTRQGAQKVIDRFVDLDILSIKDAEVTYGRSYIYRKYLEIFTEI